MHSFQFDVMTGALTSLIRVIVAENNPITSLSFAQWATRDRKEPTILTSCRNNTLYLLRCACVLEASSLGDVYGGRHMLQCKW